jgi:DNA-binding MarR family transcriptional regulator
MEKNDQSAKTEALERLFHEPNRLSILSTVCAEDKGLSFNELKEQCGLTDGNLNRHLKTLQEAGVVRIDKKFVDLKPRTTISITRNGLAQFSEYLAALEAVLDQARRALPAESRRTAIANGRLAATA